MKRVPWMVVVLLLLALVGFPLDRLLAPILFGVLVAGALAWIVGARSVGPRYLAWALAIGAATAMWAGFSFALRETASEAAGDLDVRAAVCALVALAALVGGVYLAAKAAAVTTPRHLRPARPAVRRRTAIVEPEHVPPGPGAHRPHPGHEADLDLFGEHDDE